VDLLNTYEKGIIHQRADISLQSNDLDVFLKFQLFDQAKATLFLDKTISLNKVSA
jgi:hypothetical protein